MKRLRTIITPEITSDFSASDGPLTFWKQILPEGEIHYDGRRIKFDRAYLQDLITSFNNGEVEQTMFQLANPLNGHGRDFDPERQRASATAMRLANPGEQPGLYAKLQFFSKKAARAVQQNPGLGVSARVRENFVNTRTGEVVKRAVVHVLGTIDPRVTGMSPWQPVDLSAFEAGDVLDLSHSDYQGVATMAKRKTADLSATETLDLDAPLTAEQIAEMSNEEIAELLAAHDAESGSLTDTEPDSDEDDEDEDESEEDSDEDKSDDEDTSTEPDGDTNLSRSAQRQIDLANASAREANARATEALRRAADADWQRERADLVSAGVPPVMLDLAAPILNRPDAFEVDLSHEGGETVSVGEIVRNMLNESKGTIDMSNELGHGGGFEAGGADPDADILASWNAQYPAAR